MTRVERSVRDRDRGGVVIGRRNAGLVRAASILGALAALCMLAPGAGAVLVHAGKGRIAGLTPVKGVPPASLHNRLVAPSSSSSLSATGNLDYHGGPVLH